MTTLGDRIKLLRERKGYSLDDLSRISKTSKSYLWDLEHNNHVNPSMIKMSAIIHALDTTTEYLLGLNKDENEMEILYMKFKDLSDDEQNKIISIIDIWRDKRLKEMAEK